MMKMIRYDKISEKVYNLIQLCQINAYPINFRELTAAAYKLNIEFETYESFEKHSPNAAKIFGSKDGAAAYFPDENFYIIFYNSTGRPQGRINWTIAHEMGHILMEHYTKSDVPERDTEGEADHFAKLLLCHPLILEKCGVKNRDDIQKLCQISSLASVNRENELKSAVIPYNKWDKLTAEIFADFISKKMCVTCGSIVTGNETKFCEYCGDNNFTRGTEVFLKQVKHVPLKCPVCENQDLLDSNFCKICGLNLKNPCTICGQAAGIPALYCPYCKGATELSTYS